jgi:hypothetical protein
MKLLIVVSLCMVMVGTFSSSAQEYKKFRVGVGLGYAKAGGKGASGGVLWAIEPGYLVSDQILANLRIESATVVRGTVSDTGADFDVAGIGSYTLNSQYHFTNNGFRPFAGVGLGMYNLAAIILKSSTGSSASAETKFGFYPRVGFDAGHFTVCIDYNFIPNTRAVVSTGSGTTTHEFKNSYIGFRIGGFFGGGKK